jgi:protein YIPF5/7
MAQYGYPQQSAQNLQFYPSSYPQQPVSGHSTPFQAYNSGPASNNYANTGFSAGFGGQSGVSGRMGEQGGLRTGWLAAFGTEGYDGEPPLLEELGVNFAHIKLKVTRQLFKFHSNQQLIGLSDPHSSESFGENRSAHHG